VRDKIFPPKKQFNGCRIVVMEPALRILLGAILFISELPAQNPPLRAIPSRPEVVPPEVLNGIDVLLADPRHYKLELEND
jgi:hypothetical protein